MGCRYEVSGSDGIWLITIHPPRDKTPVSAGPD
jgi:hypothetical protein